MVAIFVKESLGEYGSGWGWNTYNYEGTHVFNNESSISKLDQYGHNTITITPVKFINTLNIDLPVISSIAGKAYIRYGKATSEVSSTNCKTEMTDGSQLYSASIMSKQQSCIPHTYNLGNYYLTDTTMKNVQYNSICAKGWMTPRITSKVSYQDILKVYNIHTKAESGYSSDAALINLPFSFIRSGYYVLDGSSYRSVIGNYLVYAERYGQFSVRESEIGSAYGGGHNGRSLRCVKRKPR